MKFKIIIMSLILGTSILNAFCKKKEISELQYMTKEELIRDYKFQYASYVIYNESATKSMTELRETYSKIGANHVKEKLNESSCYLDNSTNIGRILKKDYKFTDEDLKKLETKSK